ncbi:TetR/AcrR family transcriptional regulator [Aquibacillus sp. 3ASR75-11]|uniref:TetR/AcrR family transcriptional regulator n=1 Tax=Terrihalobacillus insolitus TaxID=2950438 RepID=A0A9X4AMF9_9BACI|nr:TetR/AcrR family transcriptional regulator [Terrihalobacillus insolitus]MDC3414171.1 TetR/AcrR family transcriptional regulator [Terrihalobacillus insolitus]MDC3425377.1 TetR/AcrR family transcriptional regulator [Terrihalobacillus insolitus]
MARRGRKKGSNGEESRLLLLTIAAEEFAKKGYQQTKVSDIVKQAKVTQPTFYIYFQSKEALFQELVDSFRTQLVNLVSKSRLESGLDDADLSNTIKSSLLNIFTFFAENPYLTKIGFFIAQEAGDIKKGIAEGIKENLDDEISKGYFNSNFDTKIVAESLVGVIERLTLTKLLDRLIQPENLANQIVQLFLYGIENKKRIE